jgi:hypothetical protein
MNTARFPHREAHQWQRYRRQECRQQHHKVVAGSITPSQLAGAVTGGLLSATVPANSCANLSAVFFGGDVLANDIPLLVMEATGVLPVNMSLTALRVPASNRFDLVCNS